MAKKHLSLIIVPHTKTSCRTLSFSRRLVKTVVIGGGIVCLALLVFLVDYFSMNHLRRKHKILSQESINQNQKIADYERYITQLQATIANFEEYTKKLNVMAGLKSPDVIADPAGLGGGPSDDSNGDSEPDQNGGSLSTAQFLNNKAESIESNLGTLVSYFESESLRLDSTPSVMPTAGWMSSPFGTRDDPFTGKPTMHWGIDIATNIGNPIFATADGIVIKVRTDKILGKYVSISHGFGFTTLYGHMNGFAVREGQKVKRGEVIGYIGKTGKAVGPHVHYEVRVNGRSVNPWHYLLEE